jgi:hypothetical protein
MTDVKRGLVVSGVAIVLAILLSSPTFAQTAPQPASPTPAPITAPEATPAREPDASVPLDALIDQATTPEARAKLLLRCSGPPPRLPKAVADASKPAAEKPAG